MNISLYHWRFSMLVSTYKNNKNTLSTNIKPMKIRHFLFLLLILLSLLGLSFSAELRVLFFQYTQIDTVGHFISFFCLTLIIHSVIKLPLTNTCVALACYAALSEFGQYYLGFRNGEFRDFIADVLGIAFFCLLKWVYLVYWRKNIA